VLYKEVLFSARGNHFPVETDRYEGQIGLNLSKGVGKYVGKYIGCRGIAWGGKENLIGFLCDWSIICNKAEWWDH
jgi:hypothetical protein